MKSMYVTNPPYRTDSTAAQSPNFRTLQRGTTRGNAGSNVESAVVRKKFNVVLDLDLTLVCTCPIKTVSSNAQLLRDLKQLDKIWLCGGTLVSLFRPHVRLYLQQIAEHFNVYVHTHGIRQYAEKLMEALGLTDISQGLKCRETMTSSVVEKSVADLGLSPANTIVIDDRASVWRKEERNIVIQVPPFHGSPEDSVLSRLSQLMVAWIRSGPNGTLPDLSRQIAHWCLLISNPVARTSSITSPNSQEFARPKVADSVQSSGERLRERQKSFAGFPSQSLDSSCANAFSPPPSRKLRFPPLAPSTPQREHLMAIPSK
jgi:hypothetical protein